MSISLRFWGVRGSLPVPGSDTTIIGGNTSCVEIALPTGDVMLIDCGTGARAAGRSLQRHLRKPRNIHIFFSHFHWDHIQGLPFFAPVFNNTHKLTFYSNRPPKQLKKMVEKLLTYPHFPTRLEDLPKNRSYVQITNSPLLLGQATISSFRLYHPQGAWGYRVEYKSKSVVYASDHEHGNPACDLGLREAARNTDVLIYDAQYTPSEYRLHCGWGHSTWLEGANIAKQVGVKRLVLFHHSPDRRDADVDKITRQARNVFHATIAAREGLKLKLPAR